MASVGVGLIVSLWMASLLRHLRPSLIDIRRGGVIGDKLTVGITSALDHGYVHYLFV
jgi:hypothetical protein